MSDELWGFIKTVGKEAIMKAATWLLIAVFGAVIWKTGVQELILQNPYWFFGVALGGALWGVGSWARRGAQVLSMEIRERKKRERIMVGLGEYFDYRETPESLPVRFVFSSVSDLDTLHVGSLVPVCSQRTSPQCCGNNLLVAHPSTGQMGYYCKECGIQYTSSDTGRLKEQALSAIRRRISELKKEASHA